MSDPVFLPRRLTRTDYDDVQCLQAAAIVGLPAGYVRPKTDAALRTILDGVGGAAFGIGGPGALEAVSLVIAHASRTGSGPPFPRIPAADWPSRACFVENTMVAPAARGRGHQRALFPVQRAYAEAAGMGWMCSGVNLDNVVSWRNRVANGMAIVGMRRDLGPPIIGLLLGLAPRGLETDPADRREVAAQDADAHEAAFQAGYAGVRLTPGGAVIYERLSAG